MSGTWKQAATRRTERVGYQEAGRLLARTGDPLFVASCMVKPFEPEQIAAAVEEVLAQQA